MRQLGERRRRDFAQRFIGKTVKVLVEEKLPHGSWRGYSRNYLRVLTEGSVELTNSEVEVEVEGSLAEGAQLAGRIVPPARACAGGCTASPRA
jgi:threonylcarbamoyladenosine tRNA methylthiotransferase MtaB